MGAFSFFSVLSVVRKSFSDSEMSSSAPPDLQHRWIVHRYPLSLRARQWEAQRQAPSAPHGGGVDNLPTVPSMPTVAAFGSFDGIHLGHQSLVRQVLALASQGDDPLQKAPSAATAVVELYPHPAVTLGRVAEYRPLITIRQARERLRNLGVDYLMLVRFSPALSRCSAAEFISGVLQQACGITSLIVGPDAAIGAGREAQGDALVRLGAELGLSIHVMPFLLHDSDKVSSSLIRQQLAAGAVEEAADGLGAYHELDGKVVRGDGRGRGIGFPTANIHTRQLVPAIGVYACWAEVDGQRFMAATNVGVAPTFRRVSSAKSGTASQVLLPRVEAHLLDFPSKHIPSSQPSTPAPSDGDIYGKRIKLSFVKRIRTEQRFNSAAELVQRIQQDVLEVRKILES